MQTKIAVILIVTFTAIVSAGEYNNQNNDQPVMQITIGDTAPVNNEMQPETENEKSAVTFTRKTPTTSDEEASVGTKKNKQTIRGLFTLGGFNENEKNKSKIRTNDKD